MRTCPVDSVPLPKASVFTLSHRGLKSFIMTKLAKLEVINRIGNDYMPSLVLCHYYGCTSRACAYVAVTPPRL